MNCQVVQNKILMLPDPRLVPDALRAHVAGCAGCRSWAQQAARLESLLEELPAPPAPADKREALIAGLNRGDAIVTRPPAGPAPARSGASRVLELLRRNASLVGGLAAAVLVAVGGWWLVTRNGTTTVAQPTPEDPFLKKVVQRDVALAKAHTPAERLQALTGLADDLSGQARALARVASPDELKELARLYERVVKEAAVKQARTIYRKVEQTPDEKEALKVLTDRLAETAAEADRLTGEVPADAKPALQTIAAAAREGQKQTVELRGKAE